MKLLIIDDEFDIREMIRDYFGARGFEVQTAEDGGQGLQAAQIFNPDVVLLDIKMKRTDGHQIIPKLKAQIPKCKVFVVSAYQDERTKKMVEERGADAFFEKPIAIKTLERSIKKTLET